MRTIAALIMIVACMLPSAPTEKVQGTPVPITIVPTEDCPNIEHCDA